MHMTKTNLSHTHTENHIYDVHFNGDTLQPLSSDQAERVKLCLDRRMVVK